LIAEDKSYGIHNPAFTVALLKVSIQALINQAVMGQIVAIDDVPNDQGKQVKVIWSKFTDDGVSADPVRLYKVLRQDEGYEVWTTVAEITADGSPRYAVVVPTLYDSTAEGIKWTTFKVRAITESGNVMDSEPAQGYSVDNLVPHAPVNLVALFSNGKIELSWEAPEDPDINYYRVYRSMQPNFEPTDELLIGTTTELKFVDANITTEQEYYYRVRAVDFSGNLGEASQEVNIKVTRVEDNEVIPLEYDLRQNYPNPFNPTTTIEFALKQAGHVVLAVYNAKGQELMKLVDQRLNTGIHKVTFNGEGLSSGIYFYQITVKEAGSDRIVFRKLNKMVLMK
jgi:hypothetical protein